MQAKELTAIEAARRLGVNLDYLYRLLLTGRLQGRRKDGRWLIPVAAVEARLKARRASNGTASS